MNINWKLIMLYSLGAGVGGFAGALLGSYIVDRWVDNKHEIYTDPYFEEPVQEGEVVEEKKEQEDEQVVVGRSKQQSRPEKVRDYAKVYKTGKERLTLQELEEEAAKYKQPSSLGARGAGLVREDQKKPHVISEEEFFGGDDSTASLTYTYYMADDTLADESEGIVPNPQDILGPEALNSFGRGTDDPDTVYIHAPAVATKYEVIRLRSSYQETVLGLEIAPPEKKAKTKKVLTNGEDN